MISQDEYMEQMHEVSIDMQEMDKLIERSVEAWKKRDELHKQAVEALNAAEIIDKEILANLKSVGKSRYYVDGVGTMSVMQKYVVNVPKAVERKKQFFEYLKAISEDVFMNMATVNSNTLNAWYNSKMDEASSKGLLGFSVPGIDEPTMRESLRFIGERKK